MAPVEHGPAQASLRFAGKVIIVTGGGAGLGAAFAEAFAAEGGRVALFDLDEGGLDATRLRIERAGGECLVRRVDVASETQVTSATGQVQAEWGGVDVLINNAGIAYGDIYDLSSIPAERLRRVMEVNVFGALFCARACREGMRMRAGGSIVNISSMASYMANGAYGLTKAAVNNLTVALAEEFSADGIRVNGIAPGLVSSRAALDNVPAAIRQRIQSTQLVRRAGSPADIAAAGLFLCSAEAGFITGQTLLVDGGFLAHSALLPVVGMPTLDA